MQSHIPHYIRARLKAGQNRLLQAGGGDDCGLWIADCGLKNSAALINPQSEFRNLKSCDPPATAGGSDLTPRRNGRTLVVTRHNPLRKTASQNTRLVSSYVLKVLTRARRRRRNSRQS